MKKLIISVCLLSALSACTKEEIKPQRSNPEKNQPVPLAIAGKDKKKVKCVIKDNSGEVFASGEECTGKGNECGRSGGCYAGGGFYGLSEPGDEIVFENITRKEFSEMWNTDNGREFLMSKGIYAENVE